MSAIQLFNNDEFELSVEFVGDGFRVYGMLVAEALGFRKAADLVRSLPDHCKIRQGASTRPPSTRDDGAWYLTEEGFYRAIGQRTTSRIANPEVRARVERFQSWVFGEVLPAIRRHGRYEMPEPQSYTWEQVAQLLYQRYGVKLSVGQITNALRAAGVLRQNGNPRSKYEDWFWMTPAGAVNVLSFTFPRIATVVTATRTQMIERLQWHQMRLELEGVPTALAP